MTRALIVAAALAALATPTLAQKAKAPAAKAAAKPAAPAGPAPADWRTPNPEDVLVIDTNKGRVLVELVPEVAPEHADRVRQLAREGFYDGHRFFRVIDGFMAQTGDPQNTGEGGSSNPDLKAEFFFRRADDTPITIAADQQVAEVGFIKSLPVMTQSMSLAPMTADGKVQGWGLYCPGVVGMARASDPNSGNSQFFLMRAHYPSLEKKYTAFGRVIAGQEVVDSLKTGEPAPDPQDLMQKVRVLADVPAKERPKVRVIDPKGRWFKAELARVAGGQPPAAFDACAVKIPVEVK